MRKCFLFAATALFVFAGGMAWAQKPAASKRQPVPASPSADQNTPTIGFTAVSQLSATPSTIPFLANNPGGTVAGGSVATINWNITQGKNGQTWTLMVGATSPSFYGCTTVPVSAISLKCVSASALGGGQASAGCNISNLSTLPSTPPGLPVASGNEGNASMHNYTVVLSYQMTDSWRYIANTCPISVSYTVLTQ
jgi:hypothetical protein